ncbi:hypothetical protein G6F57_020245 [Rhizopus arrhizus]|nr:hypothetical protein G6F65_020335 [Rhizopus arrhizus]KAG1437444.1 hypothetical protein G6F57_020245 [Rhizopus arrhizus]
MAAPWGAIQFLQGVADDVRVFDIEGEADVGQLLRTLPVVDVMEDHDIGRRQLRQAGSGHAPHRPAVEGMAGDHQAEFDFGQVRRAAAGQMGRRRDQRGAHGRRKPS